MCSNAETHADWLEFVHYAQQLFYSKIWFCEKVQGTVTVRICRSRAEFNPFTGDDSNIWKRIWGDTMLVKIMRKASSTTGETNESVKTQSESVSSTDHPLHNAPSQRWRSGNRLTTSWSGEKVNQPFVFRLMKPRINHNRFNLSV